MNSESKRATVVVAMSGGVDSSVAAALLLEQGYNVVGVTMKTYDFDEVGGNVQNEVSCCGLGAMQDARLVASKLGIPHYVVDFREAFGRKVVDYFVGEYLDGKTPNPCIVCNRDIKWGELLRKAEALGAQYVATGHYAQLRLDEKRNRFVVSRGRYLLKDQSYALWAVSQPALRKTLFPLGQMTKPEVRELALKYGLRTAQKEESYEICFVADNDYERFLRERVGQLDREIAGGDIVSNGNVVGRHGGYPFYTIGQRKGIGAHGAKMYVTGIDKDTNVVNIGREQDLFHTSLTAIEANWVGIAGIDSPRRVHAQVRYKDHPEAATVYPVEGGFRVEFEQPKRAITPGQSVVLYEDDDVLGGGIIDKILM